MTVELCLSACREKGYEYSGLQWQSECYCGSQPREGFKWAWYGKCNDRCAGNQNQICGGSNALSLYTTPIMKPGGLCIYDNPSPRRVLDGLSVTGMNNLTVDSCNDICRSKLWTRDKWVLRGY